MSNPTDWIDDWSEARTSWVRGLAELAPGTDPILRHVIAGIMASAPGAVVRQALDDGLQDAIEVLADSRRWQRAAEVEAILRAVRAAPEVRKYLPVRRVPRSVGRRLGAAFDAVRHL